MKLKCTIIMLLLSICLINPILIFSQNQSNEYEEFDYLFAKLAYSDLGFYALSDQDVESIGKLGDNEKMAEGYKIYTQIFIENIIKNAASQFGEYVNSLGIYSKYEIKYILENLASSDEPIESMRRKLKKENKSFNDLNEPSQYFFTMSYIRSICYVFDKIEKYNFITAIVLGKTVREMRGMIEQVEYLKKN